MSAPTDDIERAESARRLLVLADFLDTIPLKRFDYETWAGASWKGKKDLSCGTTACALGWATTIPAFKKLGLKLVRVKEYGEYIAFPVCGTAEGSDAACEPFLLSDGESLHLFTPHTRLWDGVTMVDGNYSPGEKATPKQVAKHIRSFVAKHRAPVST